MHSSTGLALVIATAILTTSSAAGLEKFNVYWNVRVDQCDKAGVTFDTDRFGLIHNKNNELHGSQINIYYRMGAFPNNLTWKGQLDNGGIPQRGNLTLHRVTLKKQLSKHQDKNFNGVSVLDFEDYLPEYNDLLKDPYRIPSDNYTHLTYPELKGEELIAKSKDTWQQTAKPFFETGIDVNKEVAGPKALIGYYHYPYCKNTRYWEHHMFCSDMVKDMNDRLGDVIFERSTALFPRAYIFWKYGRNFLNQIRVALQETKRVNKKNLPIVPYFWYRYKGYNTSLLIPDRKIIADLWEIRKQGDSMVIWGSHKDIKDNETCSEFKTYFEGFLGPMFQCLAGMSNEEVSQMDKDYPVGWMQYEESVDQLTELVAALRKRCKVEKVYVKDDDFTYDLPPTADRKHLKKKLSKYTSFGTKKERKANQSKAAEKLYLTKGHQLSV